MLGERGVGKAVLEVHLEDPEEEEGIDDEAEEKPNEEAIPAGTDTSGRDENEVEEVVGLFDGDDDVFLNNHDNGSLRRSEKLASKTSPKKSPTGKGQLFSRSDDNGTTSVEWTPHSKKAGSPRKVPKTPEGMLTEIVTSTGYLRQLRQANTPADEPAPSSSPIDSPSNRKANRKLQYEDDIEDLSLSTRKRKLASATKDGDTSESEAGRRTKIIRKMEAKPIETIILDSDDDDDDDARPCPPVTWSTPSSKVESKTSPQKANKIAGAPTASATSPVQASLLQRRLRHLIGSENTRRLRLHRHQLARHR